ncbi:ATP-grasp domain-containing protein [Brevibacillus migulae]|uniref:ATP-grasp domain-containing protein n=1 Tax=Brevibacillus migulae TaxID=1644114 RepID=UPI00106E6AFD|nr:ATP-grasp domain-containing protein [Brevibacillus migulae]
MIKPVLSLTDIFGPHYIFNGRGSYQNSQWLPTPLAQDSSSGSMIAVAGDTPLMCHRDVADPACLSLLREAGLQVGQSLHVYGDERGYYERLKRFQEPQQKMVINYNHLPEEIPEDLLWVRPQLLSYVNNKKHLAVFVPEPFIPKRRVLSSREFLDSNRLPFAFPYVVKAATDEPNGGGADIVICRQETDLRQARQLFKHCSAVVVEEFLSIQKNYCIQFAQTYRGELVYLGAAEQIITEEGKYLGNWVDQENQPPDAAIELCKRIVEKAVSLGYWGFAGIDTVITEDNRLLVIDLNFRQNGSTGALLLRDSIMHAYDARVLKLRKWKSHLSFAECTGLLQTLMGKKMLVPLCIYKPRSQSADNPVFVSSLIAGNSKDDIIECEKYLQHIGLE